MLVVVQVWSLTQFYFVDFYNQRSAEKGAFFTNTHSRFASVSFEGVLETLGLARRT